MVNRLQRLVAIEWYVPRYLSMQCFYWSLVRNIFGEQHSTFAYYAWNDHYPVRWGLFVFCTFRTRTGPCRLASVFAAHCFLLSSGTSSGVAPHPLLPPSAGLFSSCLGLQIPGVRVYTVISALLPWPERRMVVCAEVLTGHYFVTCGRCLLCFLNQRGERSVAGDKTSHGEQSHDGSKFEQQHGIQLPPRSGYSVFLFLHCTSLISLSFSAKTKYDKTTTKSKRQVLTMITTISKVLNFCFFKPYPPPPTTHTHPYTHKDVRLRSGGGRKCGGKKRERRKKRLGRKRREWW